MAPTSEPPRAPPGGPESPDPLEALVAECLRRMEEEGAGALDLVCAAHREHASGLRREIAKLRALGWTDEEPARDPLPRREIGDFELVARIGGGGMGVVYRARQKSLDREVALKLVRPESLFFEGARARFGREMAALARLQHPGIVPVHVVGEDQGLPFIAMELVRGCTLLEAISTLQGRTRRPASGGDLLHAVRERSGASVGGAAVPPTFRGNWVETCVRIALQVAEALAHAHSRGIVHRDVKPSNVMLTPEGRAMLVDFGLALAEGASRLTRSETQPGSLPYMSPEQLRGEREIDARTDVYSLGVVLRELLTLQPAYADASSEGLRQAILAGEARPVRAVNPAVPRDVETVCLKAMDLDRAHRYASAAAFARDLDNILALRPIDARRQGPMTRAWRFAQRQPARTATAGLALALAVAAGAIETWRRLERERLESEIVRLADLQRWRELSREAESELWPVAPSTAGAMQGWLERARALSEQRTDHERTLLALRARATRRPDGAAAGELRLDGADDAWGFDDDTLAWQHATLTGLLRALDADLPRAIARVSERFAIASGLAERTLDGADARARWAAAIADIRSLPHYGGLELAPQLGLLPLWRNPRSQLWEFLHVASGEEPPAMREDGRVELLAGSGFVLVLLPAARATIGSWPVSAEHPAGSPFADPFHRPNELPPHEVALDRFFLSKFEATRAQWLRMSGADPSSATCICADGAEIDARLCPAENVSWSDATVWLERYGLELPTAAQWEYACRAGTSAVHVQGDLIATLLGFENVAGDSYADVLSPPNPVYELEFHDGFHEASPVGWFQPNRFGLHDTLGNVMEWCRDLAGSGWEPYSARPARAGDGLRDAPPTHNRAVRGGSFWGARFSVRAAFRSDSPMTTRQRDLGVRPARRVER